jgi:hypothetical protein
MGNTTGSGLWKIKIPITSLVEKVWWNNSRNSVKPSTAKWQHSLIFSNMP